MTEPGKMTEPDALDALFAQARTTDLQPTDGLLVRIMADAVQVTQQRQQQAVASPASVRSRGLLSGLVAALGGWPAMGGLAMATATGLYIGVAPPDSLTAIGQAVWGETVTVSLDDPLGLSGLEG